MDSFIYEKHYKTIKDLITNLGIDSTDDYLKQELSDITKSVIHIKERISNMRKSLEQQTNTDEITHLKYDIEETNDLLNNLLKHLQEADERYLSFKEYSRRKNNQNIE
jgi:predicted  nucleic acid-binding Zn-ribbon protein